MADPEESGPTGEQDDPQASNDAVVGILGFPATEFAGIRDGVIADAMTPGRDAHAAAWRPIGPRNIGGAIRSLVQDANQPSRFYAGSAQGGLWRTDDDGLSWKPMGGPQQAFPFGALALAPYDSRILYAGTGEPFQDRGYFAGDGLFLSTDGGETLTRIAPAARNAAGAPPGAADHYARLRVDPRAAKTVGAGRITSAGTAVTGGGGVGIGVTTFTTFFAVGDLLRAGDELRVVTAVANDTELTVDRPFPADLAAPTAYSRATPRVWVAGETGLWRFEPGQGFVASGLPLPAGADPRITDVVLAEDPAAPNTVVLFAGLAGQGHAGAQAGGIFRGVFDRTTGNTAWTAAVLRRPTGPNPRPVLAAGSFGRVKLAMTAVAPFAVYAVFEDLGAVGAAPQGHPTHVYASNLTGAVWTSRGRMYAPAGGQGIAYYTMALAVHPRDPNWLIGGSVGLFTSINGGTAWQRILDEDQFDAIGERGEHADQHEVVFDARDVGQARDPAHPFDGQRVWIANDGGLASTDRVNTVAPFRGWRQRSYGIVIAQFNALSSHPRFPHVMGGGLQDMGSWVSYGGSTWYYVDGGDGGALAWNPDPAGTAPRVFYTSVSDRIDRATVGAATFPGARALRTTLPDVAPPGNVMRAQLQLRALPFPAPFFVRMVACHPGTADHLVVGWQGGARRSTNGTAFTALPTPAFHPANADVRIVAYVPGQASDHFWLGTSAGEVFRTDNATAFANVTPPWTAAAPPIWRLTMVASGADYRVTVASVSNTGEIFVADVTGAAVNWRRLTGLPATPLLSVAFDPDDPRTLFVGTLAGVYGATDLPAFGLGAGAALAPTWQTYNTGLPLAMVTDLAVVPLTKTLRCATYGRGAFERDLASTPADHRTPAVKLLLRNHLLEDGRTYPADNSFRSDPRQGAAAGALDDLRSIDVRVDAPLFRAFETMRFGEPIDGAEFDETLVHDSPVAGDRNVVYVQVQNRGNGTARNAAVHLYWAAAADPAHPPDLQAGFRAAFPGDPPAGPWQRVGPAVTVGEIGPGQPVVVQFDWVPPLDLGAGITNAALLAITSQTPDDPLDLGAMAPENDVLVNLVRNERRVAARVTPVVANPVYLRDGVDDDGSGGAVAWGGRSPDIVVLAAAPPADVNTNPLFTDLDDPRRGDRVRAGANPVIVRVHNRSGAAVTADVDLYRVPLNALDRPAAWTRINAPNAMRTPAIPPRAWRFTAAVTWTVPAADTATAFVLVALVSPVLPAGAAGTPKPDPATDVQNLETLWRFVRSGALSDKVAMRALRRI